jgi:hypothetical protein
MLPGTKRDDIGGSDVTNDLKRALDDFNCG